MEEVMDFDQWVEAQSKIKPKFYLIYDEFGNITGIYPEIAAAQIDTKVEFPEDLRQKINAGEDKIQTYKVDVITKQLVIPETMKFFNGTPLLLRATEIDYSENKDFEVYITYKRKESLVSVELSFNVGGTRTDRSQRRILDFHPDLSMKLYFTDYNDPNILHDKFEIKILDLLKGPCTKTIDSLPERFGVFTKHLFDRYGFETDENS